MKPHKRHLRQGNIYRVLSFTSTPEGNLASLLRHKVTPTESTSLDILPPDGESGGFIAKGLNVEVLTGHLRGSRLTLPEIQLLKVRIRKKCRCAAHPYPHYPSTTCIKEAKP